MVIKSIKVQNEGHVYCKSDFYTAHDTLDSHINHRFYIGTNKLKGEIDSGVWAISYLLSMYKFRPDDFILFDKPNVVVNDDMIFSLNDISAFTCYMDKLYPLFSSTCSIKELVAQGLINSRLNYSLDDVRNLFSITRDRFERPLTGTGNEIFKTMSAIGFCYKKEVFCFPWLSQKRFESYHSHMTDLIETMERLGKIVILPLGNY